MATQKEVIAELKLALIERRADWRQVGHPPQFPKIEHQRRYEILADLLEKMEAMYAAEFQLISNRVARLKEEAAKQTALAL